MIAGRLARRLWLAVALLIGGWGFVAGALTWRAWTQQERETVQRLSYGLARHIVEHWPEVARSPGAAGPVAPSAAAGGGDPGREDLLRMLMTVNPAIQVYLLDAQGRVQAYLGEPGLVREAQVDLDAVRRFLRGDVLPIVGSDPAAPGEPRIFSVAPLGERAGAAAPPGYLYIVLEGPARDAVAQQVGRGALWRHVAGAAALAGVLTLAVGAVVLRRLTRPLSRLAGRLRGFDLVAGGSQPAVASDAAPGGDEVAAIDAAFDAMVARVQRQSDAQRRQAAAHREVVAGVAHDLRTPLTALHGHLEALRTQPLDAAARERHTATALAQSDKLRRLTQQLFELATLQTLEQVPHAERFRLDELVADAVQKFELQAAPTRVALAGQAPGAVELEGDGHLIERALTNLIDNALRHAPSVQAVQVSLQLHDGEVAVLVEDRGPGLPEELASRLNAGEPVREPAQRRASSSGGGGGLGLAIAQRIAALHGGRLQSLPVDGGGTRLCLALPRPRAA